MRKFYLVSLLASVWLLAAVSATAQTSYFTKQVIIVNGGNYSDPDDYVTVAAYDPVSGETTEFATIYTQSVQDVLIVPPYAYVAAQDSIVLLNIDTYEKLASVEAQGVHQLVANDDVLVASFWYPVTANFVRTYNLSDLLPQHVFSEISDEAAGMMVIEGNYLFVAIPGTYGSTTGKIAVIDLASNIVMDEDDFGEFFAGVGYFAMGSNHVNVFMKTPYGGNSFNVATLNFQGEVEEQYTYEDASLANEAGCIGQNIYLEINNGIAEYSLATHEIVNPALVQPQVMSISASVLDTVNHLIYLTTTDYYSTGAGFIYNMEGDDVGSFEAGISAQAIAVDYRASTGINKNFLVKSLNIYPNPASTTIHLTGLDNSEVLSTEIMNVTGKVVYAGNDNKEIDISAFRAGVYFVSIHTSNSVYTGKFIKN